MQVLLMLSMAYAAIGLLLSLCVHLLSILGIQPAGNGIFFALHAGIFPLWFFIMLPISKMFNGVQMFNGAQTSKDFWKVVLRGCPTWMKYMTYGFFIYAGVNFLIFFLTAPYGKLPGGGPPPSVWHGFSGHWMAFYSAGLAVATSTYRIGWGNLVAKCPNGHDVAPGYMYCPICGTKIGM